MLIIVIYKKYVLQGSVATQLSYDGIINNHVIANFPRNVLVKK